MVPFSRAGSGVPLSAEATFACEAMLSPNVSGAWTLAMTLPVSSATLTVSTPSAFANGAATASTAARSFDATAAANDG